MIGKNQDEYMDFKPFQGLGKISFSSDENDIVSILGKPQEREIYYYNTPAENDEGLDISSEPIQYTVNLYYSSFAIFIGYEDNRFQGTSIHLNDLILDGHRFSEMYKEDVLDFLVNYHSKNKLRFICQTSYAENTDEECYEYDNLGLTIWYVGNTISNVCVMAPNTWEM